MWLAGLVALVALGLVVLTWLVRASEPRLAFFPTRGEDETPGHVRRRVHRARRRRRATASGCASGICRARTRARRSSTSTATAATSRCGADILVDLLAPGSRRRRLRLSRLRRQHRAAVGARTLSATSTRSSAVAARKAPTAGRAARVLGTLARHDDGGVCGDGPGARRRRARGRVSLRCGRSSRPIRCCGCCRGSRATSSPPRAGCRACGRQRSSSTAIGTA